MPQWLDRMRGKVKLTSSAQLPDGPKEAPLVVRCFECACHVMLRADVPILAALTAQGAVMSIGTVSGPLKVWTPGEGETLADEGKWIRTVLCPRCAPQIMGRETYDAAMKQIKGGA